MDTDQPYASERLNKALHAELATLEHIKYSGEAHALRSVALIGVMLPNDQDLLDNELSFDTLMSTDQSMIRHSFQALGKSGIPLNPEAEFHIYNLLPPVRCDFLEAGVPYLDEQDTRPKNDLAIICYVPKHGIQPGFRDYTINSGFKSFNDIEWGRNSLQMNYGSTLTRHPLIWAEAAKALHSKIVLTLGGITDEVTTNEFKGHEDFSILIDSDKKAAATEKKCTPKRQDTRRGRKNKKTPKFMEAAATQKYIPSRENMGVIMRKNCMLDYAGHIDKAAPIGAALLNTIE